MVIMKATCLLENEDASSAKNTYFLWLGGDYLKKLICHDKYPVSGHLRDYDWIKNVVPSTKSAFIAPNSVEFGAKMQKCKNAEKQFLQTDFLPVDMRLVQEALSTGFPGK